MGGWLGQGLKGPGQELGQGLKGPGQGLGQGSPGVENRDINVCADKRLDISGAGHDFPSLYLVFWVRGVEEGANRTTTGCEGWTPPLVSSRMMRVSSLQSTSGEATRQPAGPAAKLLKYDLISCLRTLYQPPFPDPSYMLSLHPHFLTQLFPSHQVQ